MIFDTDVLIWASRGYADAQDAVRAAPERSVSVITVMELNQGARDQAELRTIRNFLEGFQFRVIPLSESIGHQASLFIEQHALASRLGVTDALIAATAIETRIPLCSGNQKHFARIRGLELLPFRPKRDGRP